MASQVKIEFNSAGFREILMSEGVKSLVDGEANKIKARADSAIEGDSEGFKVTTTVGGYGGGRYVSYVQTTDWESMKAESEHKALSGAII